MKNILIYESVWNMLPKLNDTQVAILFRAINEWRLGNDPVIDDPLIQGVWLGLEPNLKSLEESYEKKVAANRENGKSGGRPKKTQEYPNNPSGFIETQPNPNNLKEKDKDKDKEKDKDKDKEMDKDKLKIYNNNKSSIHYIMDIQKCSIQEALTIFLLGEKDYIYE